jgi:enoyl-[acyl-carrier-protein] reductase (NADH)
VYGDREKAVQGASANSPLGSAAVPEEIAETLCYLASDEALHVSAHTVVIDSGVSTAGASASALFHTRPAGFLGKMPKQFQ